MQRGYLSLKALIAIVREAADRTAPYMVYSTDEDYDAFSLETRVYIAPPVTFDASNDFAEILPPDVIENGLGVFCSDELLQDVVGHALAQKPDVPDVAIVEGLKYYLVNDAFLDTVDRSD